MKHLAILVLMTIGLISSCNKDKGPDNSNAEIIGFNPNKCMCCWGWTIKIGNDTIKSDDNKIFELVGFEIKNPIKVYLELGEHKEPCNYYNILKISRVK